MAFLRLHWITLVFATVAVVLFCQPWPFVSPLPALTRAPAWAYDPTPVRQPKLRPEYVVASFTYQCSDCHRIIPSPAVTDRVLTQHREIQLRHGINTRCFNCHHQTQRDAFVDDLGQPIPWDQPQLLCAKCHGPVYRDWQHGSHGRINGYWNVTLGPQTRRKCIECHDPHAPPFGRLHPAPAPHTLRMGPQNLEHTPKRRDPLRIEPARTADSSRHLP